MQRALNYLCRLVGWLRPASQTVNRLILTLMNSDFKFIYYFYHFLSFSFDERSKTWRITRPVYSRAIHILFRGADNRTRDTTLCNSQDKKQLPRYAATPFATTITSYHYFAAHCQLIIVMHTCITFGFDLPCFGVPSLPRATIVCRNMQRAGTNAIRLIVWCGDIGGYLPTYARS